MKVLITGANGQLGKALSLVFSDVILASSKDLDISDLDKVLNFNTEGIEAIINAAAYTKVDEAEKPENLGLAWRVNSQGAANITQLATKLRVPIVHISTDYVFDGSKESPYTEGDKFSPLSVYGASKAGGDLATMCYPNHYVIRTSWVIGDGDNFVNLMKSLATKGVDPHVVNDQFGRLSFTSTIAKGVHFALEKEIPFGIYNLTNSGEKISWFDVARQVFEVSGYDPKRVSPVSTENYYKDREFIANRPKNSNLCLSKIEATGFKSEDWQVELVRYLK